MQVAVKSGVLLTNIWTKEAASHVGKLGMQNVGCKAWDAKCGMQSLGCKMWVAKCGMQNVGCKMWDAKCGLQCAGCKIAAAKLAKVLAERPTYQDGFMRYQTKS